MEFNVRKYDKIKFSDDELTNKRIKVLLLWFEHEVFKNNISLEMQIPLLVKWLEKIKEKEYYEVIPFFTNKIEELKRRVDNSESENNVVIKFIEDKELDIKRKDNLLVKLKHIFFSLFRKNK